jgi:transcriptional regulator with PAS, ATPase and Fis domain
MNSLYRQASQSAAVSAFTGVGVTPPVTGKSVIAKSPAMQRILATAATVAAVDSAVLITGESGTGKEVIAQFIHDASPRKNQDLVVINCASLPENLLEAELFGYEKGAFTAPLPGARRGCLRPPTAAPSSWTRSIPCFESPGKVLRALETKRIQRVGSTKSKQVDFRLLTASTKIWPTGG